MNAVEAVLEMVLKPFGAGEFSFSFLEALGNKNL
tara:strand:+ start:1577 stop:1678 length:102 start_codon:yes stop_codon:yes gene_type:complete